MASKSRCLSLTGASPGGPSDWEKTSKALEAARSNIKGMTFSDGCKKDLGKLQKPDNQSLSGFGPTRPSDLVAQAGLQSFYDGNTSNRALTFGVDGTIQQGTIAQLMNADVGISALTVVGCAAIALPLSKRRIFKIGALKQTECSEAGERGAEKDKGGRLGRDFEFIVERSEIGGAGKDSSAARKNDVVQNTDVCCCRRQLHRVRCCSRNESDGLEGAAAGIRGAGSKIGSDAKIDVAHDGSRRA